jgi:hypothetical protein
MIMTSITYRAHSSSSGLNAHHVPIYSDLLALVHRLQEGWNRRATEHMLESLPADIRKDIGWPTTESGPSSR